MESHIQTIRTKRTYNKAQNNDEAHLRHTQERKEGRARERESAQASEREREGARVRDNKLWRQKIRKGGRESVKTHIS